MGVTTPMSDERRLLQKRIEDAFGDMPFNGPITSVDGMENEELDEQRLLYAELHAKRWRDISPDFIKAYPDGVVLLSDDAYAAFLPAWILCALEDEKVRELLIYQFSPETPSDRIHHRVLQLTTTQRGALLEFLTYCISLEASHHIKEAARKAVVFVSRLVGD